MYFTVAILKITIQLLQFKPTNTHTVLLNPQYYSTPAATCFEPDWSVRRQGACGCTQSLKVLLLVDAGNGAPWNIYVVDRVVH